MLAFAMGERPIGRATEPNRAGDDRSRLVAMFEAAGDGETVTIPPGDYRLDGQTPIPLRSRMTVNAYGATFRFPETLGDQSRCVLFSGENLQDFRWFGGHFVGHVFDPAKEPNRWKPNANTRAIVVTTTATGETANLTFRDITADGLAGAVITVLGASKAGSDRDVERFARNVSVENCTLLRSGKFMWDYGYLWQITLWPDEHTEPERAMAKKYFPAEFVRGPATMRRGDDRVLFDNRNMIPVSKLDHRGTQSLSFFHDDLPTNITKGRQYFVVDSQSEFIRIAERPGGEAIRFDGDSGPELRMTYPLFQAHLALYAPKGSGPGKGAIDLVACENVIVSDCRLSALGDTMHIQKSRGIAFHGNQIIGSRMGAFFLAEFCSNAVITGNTVDGSNGSRVMSVEKSCQDITIVGNTFRNGGRGSWINQPKNFVLADNIFVNNTTKCEPDPKRGRRGFVTGDYEDYSELYFTTHEPGGRYENVTIRGNIFISGDHASHAISFEPGGDRLLIADNIFQGKVRSIAPIIDCSDVTFRGNEGIELPTGHANR
jgi:hypothetical protein